MALEIVKIITGTLQANGYIVYDPLSREGVIIDPGWNFNKFMRKIMELKLSIKMIIATHLHFDHVGAVEKLVNSLKIPFAYHEGEESVDYSPINTFAPYFGYGDLNTPRANRYLREGDKILLGNETKLEILHTPGHSPGSITLVTEGHAFVGDLIFAGSVGRTDIPGGDWEALMSSIRNKIFKLPDSTLLHPGHGIDTTVGFEKTGNPFIRG